MTSVLIVDDAADVRLLLRMLVSMESSFVVAGEAANPDDGVQLAADLQPDVIVTDHGFEGFMTGIEAAPHFHKAAPGAKLVLFSAYDDLHSQVAATAEIDAFVLKTNGHELVNVIKSLMIKD